MKKVFYAIVLVLLVGFNTQLNAQNISTKSIQVSDQRGRAAADITLYVMDGYTCQQYSTNRSGKAQVDIQSDMFVIYAADLSGRDRYGVSVYSPNYSGDNHDMKIPYFPRNQREAGLQIEQLFETLRYSFDMASIADLFIAIRNGTETIIPAQLGVPSVFSVNPILKKMEDGRLGIEISGILLKPIMDISAKLPGKQYVYGRSGSF